MLEIENKQQVVDLIENEVEEKKHLEYKEALPSSSTVDKKEFIHDIISFANTSGGSIIYGIKEKLSEKQENTGKPDKKAKHGLSDIEPNNEILRLEGCINSLIRPRVPGIKSIVIDGFEKGPLIVINIPPSWISPHISTLSSKFYSRNTNGKYPMDVDEIRRAFIMTATIQDRFKTFRNERIFKIISDDTPVILENSPKLILHLTPLSALDFRTELTTDMIKKAKTHINQLEMNPPRASVKGRFNFDGYLHYTEINGHFDKTLSYLQVFRNGSIEYVMPMELRDDMLQQKCIYWSFPEYLKKFTKQLFCFTIKIGVDFPHFISLTLIKVKGFNILKRANNGMECISDYNFDRDVVALPEIMIENKEDDLINNILDYMSEIIYQSAGFD